MKKRTANARKSAKKNNDDGLYGTGSLCYVSCPVYRTAGGLRFSYGIRLGFPFRDLRDRDTKRRRKPGHKNDVHFLLALAALDGTVITFGYAKFLSELFHRETGGKPFFLQPTSQFLHPFLVVLRSFY